MAWRAVKKILGPVFLTYGGEDGANLRNDVVDRIGVHVGDTFEDSNSWKEGGLAHEELRTGARPVLAHSKGLKSVNRIATYRECKASKGPCR